MLRFFRQSVDRPARDRVADVIASVIDRTIEWDAVPGALGAYSGRDSGVVVIHGELRSLAAEAAQGKMRLDPEEDAELEGTMRRTERFLRSDAHYRWHDRGPVEIVGAYLGGAALLWVAVAFAGAILSYKHELVIAGALLAMLVSYIVSIAMIVALLRRMWWRISVRREGADKRFWPFFTPGEYHAAGGEGAAHGEA